MRPFCQTKPGATAETGGGCKVAGGGGRSRSHALWWLLPCTMLATAAAMAQSAAAAAKVQLHPDLPPTAELTRDAHTLLLLAFEEPFDPLATFVKGQLDFVEDGRFGKALQQGADAYVAMSAEDFVDARSGTIEVWVKFLSPGDDRVSRAIVTVPGPSGLWLGKDQYGHVSFSIRRFWGQGARVTADGYARTWQPGVWRHVAACWDAQALQLWVDGRLLGTVPARDMPDAFGPELRLGSPGLILDDLRISRSVRYRTDSTPARPSQ